jgi:hypothetical protein
MVRRLFVPAIVAALILGVAPSPSFGSGAPQIRPRFDDHYRCMYRCDERGESFRPPHHEPSPRPSGWRSWTWPSRPHLRPPTRPPWDRPGCWLFCNGGGPIWSGPYAWCGPGPFYLDDDPYRHRPCRPHRPDWYDYDRYDRSDRHRDRDDRGYDAHRRHPRGSDF